MDAYLIESRSIGGFSGAPVFVRESVPLPAVTLPNGEQVDHPRAYGNFYLLGIMHGHWDLAEGSLNDALPDVKPGKGVNMGIAIVTPAEKISETLAYDELADERRYIIGKRRDRATRETPPLTLDASVESNLSPGDDAADQNSASISNS
jgi:hypothetical protein